jgi:hypothetical protein
LATDTPLAIEVAKAQSAKDPRAATVSAADAYLQSKQAVQSPASLKLGDGLSQFIPKIDAARTLDQLKSAVRESFGQDASVLLKSPGFAADRQRISDTLLALPLAASAPAIRGGSLVNAYRALEVIRQIASGQTPDAQAMTRPILLPAGVLPLLTTVERQPVPPPPDPHAAEAQAALIKRAENLAGAIRAISDVPAIDVVSPAPVKAKAVAQHGSLTLTAAQRLVQPDRISKLGTASPTFAIATTSSFVAQLPVVTRSTVMALGGHITDLPIALLHTELRSQFSQTVSQISITGILGSLFKNWQPTSAPAQHDDASDKPPAVLAAPPASHGTLKPAGIADLLVVRQHVLRYESGEVAYVENVASGEDFTRTTKRSDATQTTVTVAQTSSSAQERDTQATSRFDLNHQTNTVLQADYARVPGAPNSETYGALVQSGGSKTDASSAATNFGQNITSRAASQITQEFHTETVTQTSRSFEEDVVHHFDNAAAGSNKVSVYQWLDKVSQAQVFSYGKRLLYDINVPEPGSFLLRALAHQQPDVLTLQKPTLLAVQADTLDELSYLYYAAGYGATGVQPPPDLYRTVAMQWDMPPTAGDQPTINTTRSVPINIPEGYSATKVNISVFYVFWETGGGPSLTAMIGHHMLQFGGPTQPIRQSASLDGEVGTIPLTLLIDGPVYDCTVAVEVLCTRTDTSYSNWQLRTYDALLQASRDRIAEYDGKWTSLRVALQLLTFGQGEARKRQLERTELQKAAIAVLTNQQFDTLSAIEHSVQGYPQPFLPNVETVGRYVRFLEQSFEWDQMMYLFYPYFWGRKPYWIDRVLLEDADNQFGDFLRAGSARVIIPVRPGFEGVVGAFMATGAVPTTAELGQITSGEYLPYLAELQGKTDAPDTATPYGNPWEVRLPTTLTVVRKDATLPRWKEQSDAKGHAVWVSDGADPIG